MASKSTTSKSTASKGTASKATASKGTASKGTASKSTASKPTATRTTASRAAASTSADKAAADESDLSSKSPDGADVVASVPRLVAASDSAPVTTEARAPRGAEGSTEAEPAVAPDQVVATAPAEGLQPAEEAPAARDVSAPVDSETSDSAIAESQTAVSADPSGTTEAIRIRGLVKRFGDSHAVDGIDLTVPAGSFYGLVGPNGAGKTTTLSIIAGLLRPDAGTVHISGIDQRANPLGAKRVMGVLPDRLRTFDRLTGRQLLHYYGQLRGLSRTVIEKRVADLARAFDLSEALSRVVSDYSAGMTKKLMLAGALIHTPRVLVLDEPFEAVDPVSSGVILDILRSYVSHGGTVILSSHGMDLIEQVCSRVAVIVDGEVLAEGTVDEVRAGQTLAARFVELSGSGGEVEGLEWLHTFSD
ncbi:ATP-binding cassette domain-containing protein [Microbacterium sp.]|uniref:ABC transporter ATP-binding protein n=1 Tax=Microbacterium sp. TaxID=51671 RepID=UPI003C72EEC8